MQARTEHAKGLGNSGRLLLWFLAAAGLLALLFYVISVSPPPPTLEANSAPATPSSVSLTRGDGTVTANWPADSNATKYHVTYTDNGGSSWHAPVADHRNVPTNTLTFNADNAKSYIVGVRAGNDHGWSGWRNSPQAGPYTPPAPTATPTPTPEPQPTATPTPQPEPTATPTPKPTATPTPEPEPTPTATPQPEPTATPTPQPQAPTAPTGLSATGGDQAVTLAWNNPGDASVTGYQFQVNHTNTGTGNLSGWGQWWDVPNGGAATSYTIGGVANGKEYRFKLRAVNDAGNSKPSPRSAPWYVVAWPAVPAPTPTLTTSDETTDGATLTLNNYSGWWYYSTESNSGGGANAQSQTCTGPINGGQTTINGLDPNSQYTITAHVVCGGAAIASGNLFTAQSTSLTHSNTGLSTATITISGHSTNWRYKADKAPYTSCSDSWTAGNSTVNLANLGTGTTYTFAAYSDQYCSSSIAGASATFTTTGPVLRLIENNASDVTVAPHAAWGNAPYWYNSTSGGSSHCQGAGVTGSATITGLREGDDVVVKMYSSSGCNSNLFGAIGITTADVVMNVHFNATSAVITLQKHNRVWGIQQTAPSTGSCVTMTAGSTTTTFDNLTPGTTYTYRAYNQSDCSGGLFVGGGTLTFTVPKLTVTPRARAASLRLSDWSGQWWYMAIGVYNPANGNFVRATNRPCRGPANGNTTAVLTGLESSYTWGFKAYSTAADCTADYHYTVINTDDSIATNVLGAAPVKAQPLATGFTVDNVTGTAARLNMGNWSSADPDWYYRADTGPHASSCSSGVTGAIENLTGLTANTTYIYEAYSDSSCHYSTQIAMVKFTTVVRLTVTVQTWRSGTLAISGWTGDWWHDNGRGSGCSKVDSPATQKGVSLDGDGRVAHSFRAYGKAGCNDADLIAAAERFVNPPEPSITVDHIGANTATVTLNDWDRQWWYRTNSGELSDCLGPVAAGTNTVTYTYNGSGGLPNFVAYEFNSCSLAQSLITRQVPIPNMVVGNINEASSTAGAGIVGRAGRYGLVKRANQFTTSSVGTVQNVTIRLRGSAGTPSGITVALHNADASGKPGSLKKTLSITTIAGGNPTKPGEYIYKCSGGQCSLSANTSYFIVVSASGVPSSGYHFYSWQYTSADTETTEGSDTWTIGDVSHISTDNGAWQEDTQGRSLRFKVHAR